MFEYNDIKITLLMPGSGKVCRNRDGYIHCKTTPYIIFAQAYVGHYELTVAGQTWRLRPGEAFFTPPNLPLTITHRVEPESGEMRMRWLHFNVVFPGGIPLDTMFDFPFRVDRETSDKLAVPIDELQQLDDTHTIAAAVRKNQLGFTCIHHLLPLLRPRKNLDEFYRMSPQLLPLLDYINRHIHRAISLDELARYGHLSRAGLCRLFTAALNAPPYHYILRVRLEQIAECLRNSSASIGEIAAEFNYPNQFLLSRQFKANYGISPHIYRQTQAWKYAVASQNGTTCIEKKPTE